MDRWKVYEILKNSGGANIEQIKEIEEMAAEEVKEGLIEWLLVNGRVDNGKEMERWRRNIHY
mgnify:FL=1